MSLQSPTPSTAASAAAAVANSPSPPQKKAAAATGREFVISVASRICSQPLQNSDPSVWGVLTAISSNARKRPQGINMLLTGDEHSIGRVVEDPRFQISSAAVSGKHCKLYRSKTDSNGAVADPLNNQMSAFLKDTSTNGTFLNWEKLKKTDPEAKVHHGDIISFAAPPEHELAFAFVYREAQSSSSLEDKASVKRKAEDFVSESKRLKGIGIGAPEGPISLDDFRSLQRSNKELRKQLEDQLSTIDTLKNESRTATERHVNDMKELKESITKSYCDQLEELRRLLETKQKELAEASKVSAEQKHAMEDLSERFSASMQSCYEANEIINSQKTSIAELKEQLDEERDLRRKERDKSAEDLKAAVQRAQLEAQAELQRLSDAASRREREQQEVLNKLQESERERCLLVENLRSKLEDTRQKLVISDNRVRLLENQINEEQVVSANARKRVEELECEITRSRNELESEKAAREEAWAKVSSLELEINAAVRDLDFERQRLKGARERIMLRETQLRSFYQTTEDIQRLFAKQQEQLKAMQRTLEDEENYENTSVDIDLNINFRKIETTHSRDEAIRHCGNNAAKAGSANSAQHSARNQVEASSEEASATEKHDCDIRSQEGQNTQEAEFSSIDRGVKGGFGSDIDGVGTAPFLEGDAIGTERILETESPGHDVCERNIDLNKCNDLAGDTMQLEDDSHAQDGDERAETGHQQAMHSSQLDNAQAMEDTEAGATIRTADLLTSEVAGSWALNTGPSVYGENESPRSMGNDEECAAPSRRSGGNDEEGAETLPDSNAQAAESQNAPSSGAIALRRKHEHQALTEMIGIIAPDLKEQFGGINGGCDREREGQHSASNSDTEGCSDTECNNKYGDRGGLVSDSETDGGDQNDERKSDDAMDEENEATQDDSVS